MEMKWWEKHDNRIELVHWLYDIRYLKTPADVIRFFEKPWKWDAQWDEMHTEPDYTCLKCDGKGTVDTDDGVQNCHLYIITCPDCGGSGLDAPPEWEEAHGLENPDDWAKREPVAASGVDQPEGGVWVDPWC